MAFTFRGIIYRDPKLFGDRNARASERCGERLSSKN